MNKFIRAGLLMLCLGAGQSAHAGIPVIDGVSNGARMLEFGQTVTQWAKEIAEMQQQYTMLTNQYTQLQKTYTSANGVRDWANAASNTYDKVDDWSDKLSDVDYSEFKEAAKIVGVEDMPFDADSTAGQSMTNAQNTNAFNMAMNRDMFSRIKKRVTSLETLSGKINTATDAKDIADLGARITAEQTLLQNEQNSMQATAMLQQNQRDIQDQQSREMSIKMGKLVNIQMAP